MRFYSIFDQIIAMTSGTQVVMLQAQEYLSNTDAVLAQLIIKHGNCLLPRKSVEPYGVIVRSIISQQLSKKAADTIEDRFLDLAGDISPINVLDIPVEKLRGAGLSASKAKYIRELSNRMVHGLLNFDDLTGKTDDDIINILTEIPGIGRWTAEMFLIFGLGRLDVLALADAGLKRSGRQLYGEGFLLEVAGKPWRPYRSVASWYLWKHLDG